MLRVGLALGNVPHVVLDDPNTLDREGQADRPDDSALLRDVTCSEASSPKTGRLFSNRSAPFHDLPGGGGAKSPSSHMRFRGGFTLPQGTIPRQQSVERHSYLI